MMNLNYKRGSAYAVLLIAKNHTLVIHQDINMKKTKYTKSGRINKSTLKGGSRTAAQKRASSKRKGKRIRFV